MRLIILANGSAFVGLDDRGQVCDFYFPYVGLENQMAENAKNRVGVWVESDGGGEISWFDDPSWQIITRFSPRTLAGSTSAVNENLALEIHFEDVLYNEKNIFIRKATIKNHAKKARTIRLFLNHQFQMYGSQKKDTVYFDPQDNTLVHYKGRRVAVISGAMEGNPFDEYSVGLCGIEGKVGTWLDAEDGVLSKNPVEHGSVDSTIGFEKIVDAQSQVIVYVWVAFAKSLGVAKKLHKLVLEKSPEHILETTSDYWNAWIKKRDQDEKASQDILDLFETSLFIMRSHVDKNGAIIASGDSQMLQYGRDNYSYVWPRDAAFIAMALDRAGYPESTKHFFAYCNKVVSPEGFFFHKYCPDGSLGSSWHPWIRGGRQQLPIQEDETALVLIALWNHYQVVKDLEFIESIYNSLIKNTASFMMGFRGERHLPFASYDLWEMKYGVHTFTAAAVCKALEVASKFSKLLGKEKDYGLYRQAANEVKEACKKWLVNEEVGFFYKSLDFIDGEVVHDETIDSSSFYGMFNFGIYDIEDPMLDRAYETMIRKLSAPGIGGIARFEGDVYFRDKETPGNPWAITTLWVAQYLIKKAKNKQDLKPVKDWLKWVSARATSSGTLSEQFDPITEAQLSASPLAWSHAEFVITFLDYQKKLKEFTA